MPRATFPKSLREFRQRFSYDGNCWEYLSQSRWPEAFRCPKCDGDSHHRWLPGRHAHECQQCGHQTPVSAGTLLHRSHLPIQDRFWAACLVVILTPGMSVRQLQRQLGCSYETEWFVLHHLRRGMVNDTQSRLAGRVEAVEVIVGGPVRGKRSRGMPKVDAIKLYDQQKDPDENINIANDPKNSALVAQLTGQWIKGWRGAVPVQP